MMVKGLPLPPYLTHHNNTTTGEQCYLAVIFYKVQVLSYLPKQAAPDYERLYPAVSCLNEVNQCTIFTYYAFFVSVP